LGLHTLALCTHDSANSRGHTHNIHCAPPAACNPLPKRKSLAYLPHARACRVKLSALPTLRHDTSTPLHGRHACTHIHTSCHPVARQAPQSPCCTSHRVGIIHVCIHRLRTSPRPTPPYVHCLLQRRDPTPTLPPASHLSIQSTSSSRQPCDMHSPTMLKPEAWNLEPGAFALYATAQTPKMRGPLLALHRHIVHVCHCSRCPCPLSRPRRQTLPPPHPSSFARASCGRPFST
jgi:hypothetical protein